MSTDTNKRILAELSDFIGPNGWVMNEVINRFGTRLVVTKDELGRYTIYRGFQIGEGAGVSVDGTDLTAERAMARLLEIAGDS